MGVQYRVLVFNLDISYRHSKINFISPSSQVLFYSLYKFRSIISKGEYSKGLIIRRSGHVFDTTFLSGQNPYNIYIIKEYIYLTCSGYNICIHTPSKLTKD